MNNFNVESGVDVKKFFEEIIPGVFKNDLLSNPPQKMDGTEFRLQFNITGENKGIYAIVVKDGKDMKIIPDGIGNPMIEITLSEPDWRKSITGDVGGVLSMFFDPRVRTRSKYNSLLELKGSFSLELSVKEGAQFNAKIRFNNTDTPAVTLKMKASDYAALVQKELNPTMAFMQGKIKFSGDMGFLMKLQSFISG
ncbi:MAG TPA: SCP2 sterol-binding domain-containing protein [bacterium]